MDATQNFANSLTGVPTRGGSVDELALTKLQDPEREARLVRDFQSELLRDLDEAFGPKQNVEALNSFLERINILLKARDRLEVLRQALAKYPGEVERIFPLIHSALRRAQPEDAELCLKHLIPIDFPASLWRARCEFQLGLLYGLKADYEAALQLLGPSLKILHETAPSQNGWQFALTGKLPREGVGEDHEASYAEEILTARLITAKGYLATGRYARAAQILCSIAQNSEFWRRMLPDQLEENELLELLLSDLDIVCKNLGGKPDEPVSFDEILATGHHGRLLSGIYHAMYVCYMALNRPQEAARARARHQLLWSSLG